jgi:hypothetical protein
MNAAGSGDRRGGDARRSSPRAAENSCNLISVVDRVIVPTAMLARMARQLTQPTVPAIDETPHDITEAGIDDRDTAATTVGAGAAQTERGPPIASGPNSFGDIGAPKTERSRCMTLAAPLL